MWKREKNGFFQPFEGLKSGHSGLGLLFLLPQILANFPLRYLAGCDHLPLRSTTSPLLEYALI